MSTLSKNDADQLCINTIRTLSMDGVQAANSGHPGTPMALAPVGYALWQRVLRYDPSNPVCGPRIHVDLFTAPPCRGESGQ
jgi:transketolase